MNWRAVASDFDGTLAEDGIIAESNIAALRILRNAGIATILISGRSLEELRSLGLDLLLFTLIVAEDGAVLFDPATGKEALLAPAVDPYLLEELRAAGVAKLKVGKCIISASRDSEAIVQVSCGLRNQKFHILQDKGTLCVLPSGIDKASGLKTALAQLRIPGTATIGLGDGENDLVLLEACGMPVAVADAVPVIKSIARIVLECGPEASLHGAVGVLFPQLASSDLL